jgi:hypothetical protein
VTRAHPFRASSRHRQRTGRPRPSRRNGPARSPRPAARGRQAPGRLAVRDAQVGDPESPQHGAARPDDPELHTHLAGNVPATGHRDMPEMGRQLEVAPARIPRIPRIARLQQRLQSPAQICPDLGLGDADHRDGLAVRARLAHRLDSSAPGEPGHGSPAITGPAGGRRSPPALAHAAGSVEHHRPGARRGHARVVSQQPWTLPVRTDADREVCHGEQPEVPCARAKSRFRSGRQPGSPE